MIRPIRLYGDPVLRRPARNVSAFDDELRELASDLIDTMLDADGLGLAAPQVGVSRRVFVVAGAAADERTEAPEVTAAEHDGGSADEGPSLEEQIRSAMVFVNPVLEATRGRRVGIEGCLSLPGLYHEGVTRHEALRIRYQDLDGDWHEREAEGRLAVVLQHESDHLAGVLFLDRLPDEERYAFMDEHRAELAQMQRDAKALLRDGVAGARSPDG